ncbi:catalase family peroxidase [uncultured Nevskia sp.]|uniref:catalase family peroxidase n=1 Tax=uncultured Nevskia sp. TaxID=228950 RepID=UPI0025CD8BBD|nr:catalase family peroxidase [uncultured Nevskia sp.]
MPDPATPPEAGKPRRNPLPALAAIAAIIAAMALAFAWVGGWLTPSKLTPARFVDVIEKANGEVSAGYRRAHAKGVCIAGTFESNGAGAALSKARVFAAGKLPVLGRMSIGGGSPHAADSGGRVRSLSLQLIADDGQEWRTAMNSFPVFMVATAQGFYDLNVASTADPATGKPDPAKMAAFGKAHPEAAPFFEWAKTAPWSTSLASTTYNGVNAFRFVDAAGGSRYVRWSMRPQTPFEAMDAEQLKAADPNFLSADLATRLAAGPLRWDLVVTVAAASDPIADPTKAWPEDRQQIVVGTLIVDRTEPQINGACRDINFDPLVLPTGIEGSDDPILAARSAIYSVSFNRREHEIGTGKAPDATGQAGSSTGGKP